MGYVFITGASMGLGEALAHQYAKKGHDLVLVSRKEEELTKVAKNLEAYKVKVLTIPYDLTLDLEPLFSLLPIDIELVINNAAAGISGEVALHSIEEENKIIDLNIKAVTDISLYFAKKFKEKKKGGIYNISSIGALMPGPYIASYYASKAYVNSFSLSLSEELKEYGVFVGYALLPRMDTHFDQHAKRSGALSSGKSRYTVASYIYRRIERKKVISKYGCITKMTDIISRVLPKKWFSRMVKKSLRNS